MKPLPHNWASSEQSCRAAVVYPKIEPLARRNVGFVGAKAGELASNLASAPSSIVLEWPERITKERQVLSAMSAFV